MNNIKSIRYFFVFLAIAMAWILSANPQLFFSPPPFHTYSRHYAHLLPFSNSVKREKNNLDCYGELWLFDADRNMIFILQVGNSFLKEHGYIYNETKTEIVNSDGTVIQSYSGIKNNNTSCVTNDLNYFYEKFGSDVNIIIKDKKAVAFMGTSMEHAVELSDNTLVVINKISGDTFKATINPSTSLNFTYRSGRMFRYSDAIKHIESNITSQDDSGKFNEIMSKWSSANECRVIDVPVTNIVKESGELEQYQ